MSVPMSSISPIGTDLLRSLFLGIGLLGAGFPRAALACSSCFGEPGSAQSQGLIAAASVLLVLVAAVQFVVVRFFWRVAKREGAHLGGNETRTPTPIRSEGMR